MKTLTPAMVILLLGSLIVPLGCDTAPQITIHEAAGQGDVKALNSHIQGGSNINATDSQGRTPLHLAAGGGHRDAVVALLQAGAQIDARDNSRKTPLALAREQGKGDIVTLLQKWPERSGRGLVDGGLGVSETLDIGM